MQYLEQLNPEQKKAVETTEGPVMIVAGAGAGKTKTLTMRIAHIINKGIPAHHVLAITFTNKAATEMKERIEHMIQNGTIHTTSRPFVSTFHALCVHIMRAEADTLGIPRYFSIIDTSDSKKIIKDAVEHIRLDPKEYVEKIKYIISSQKNKGVSLSQYKEREAHSFLSDVVKKVWEYYETELRKEKSFDFDDLLLVTRDMLRTQPHILQKYQQKFLYVHVDEYQDTNSIQNDIVTLLVEQHQNICVVGDTDQNIYSWRGADISHMITFEKKYPKTTTIFLEQNYRSTKTILGAANAVIAKNNIRIPKNLFTEKEDGEKITMFEGRDGIDEASYIALTAKQLIDSGVAPEDIAVLYRVNFLSRILEEAFLSYGISYELLGTKFFDRKEIKDVVAYLKAAVHAMEGVDFYRIINVPARGIGGTTVEKLRQGLEHELNTPTRDKVERFRQTLAHMRTILLSEPLSVALKKIIELSDIKKSLRIESEEGQERWENIMELVTLAKKYETENLGESLEHFLTDVSLFDMDEQSEAGVQGVKLLTVHAAKGLEFSYVFICGLEEDLFPHTRLGHERKTKEEAEEERRLFYVALTRAKKKLFLTHAQTRTIFGVTKVNTPSSFIDDIPQMYIEEGGYGSHHDASPLFSITF